MKTKYLIIVLLLFAIKTTKAQNPNNHWQLGVSDINFTTDPPTVSSVANNGQYGYASVSDENGNLLFYTNGNSVWNKNHGLMTNGNSQPQLNVNGVVIVPNPSNSNQYFIFRAIESSTLGSSWSSLYTYSVVEFNASNPLGILLNINANPDFSLVNNFSLRLKDVNGNDFSNAYAFSPLTVAANNSNNGYWIIAQNSNKIISYKLDLLGFNPIPIQSTFTDAQVYDPGVNLASSGSGGINIRGRISQIFKMSPDNTKLGALIQVSRQNDSELITSNFSTFNFNSTTGQFSNFIEIYNEYSYINTKIVQGFEFSNNSSNVYFVRTLFSQSNNPPPPNSLLGEIFVKNLSNLSSPARILGEFGNSTSVPTLFNFIQRDKYGNILISSAYTTAGRNQYIHKIDDQNSYSNASIVINSISLNANPINYLPQLIPILNPICPSNLIVSANVATGVDKRQAQTLITATNTISNGASAIYHATTMVFSPSFVALAGSKCHFYSEGCTNTFVARNAASTVSIPSKFDTATQTLDINEKVSVAPNPNYGIFKINITDLLEGTIEIADLYGLTFYKKTFKNQSEFEINIQDKPKGIYVIKVVAGEQVITKKIIKN